MLFQLLTQAKQFFSLMNVRQEKGQGLIEYALIILLIAVGVLVVMGLLGGQVQDIFNQIVVGLGGGAAE